MAQLVAHRNVEVTDPAIAKFVFSDRRFSIVWLALRVWLGWQWIEAGLEKYPTWLQSGDALKGFWANQLKTGVGTPHPAIAIDWYRTFLQFMYDAQAYTWFSKLVVAGELLIGVALILGLFTGIAAFFGGFMNWNFMMAGSASVNPLFFVVSVALILAWKTAGYIGLDGFLLPLLGTPWKPAIVLKRGESVSDPSPA